MTTVVFEAARSKVWAGDGRLAGMAIVVVTSLLALLMLCEPSQTLLVGAVALACLAGICWALLYASRNRQWVICMLLLVELLTSVSFGSDNTKTAAHYLLDFALCLPALPVLWHSKLIRQGGFKLFAIYFAWALITVTYSLAPIYSLARIINTVTVIAALCACVMDVESADDVTRVYGRYVIGCGVILVLLAISAVAMPQDITWPVDVILDSTGRVIAGSKTLASDDVPRFVGIFSTPNEVGTLMLATVGPALLYWRLASWPTRLLLAAAMAASTVFAVLADSRTSFIALGLGCALYLLWKYRARGVVMGAAVALAVIMTLALTGRDVRVYVERGDVGTLTGRTDVWDYTISEIKERPILGYGYEVEGEIYQSRYFPLWWGPWEEGPHSSIHENYLSHAVDVGIPATLFWLFIVLRPWFTLFRSDDDPWNLKPVALLTFVPILVLNLAESTAGDCHYSVGLLFILGWALAERYRLLALESEQTRRQEELAAAPRPVAALIG